MNLRDQTILLVASVLPAGSRWRRALLSHLSKNPGLRDALLGAGTVVDHYPVCYRQTFITNDHLAMMEDWIAVGNDMRGAMRKADEHIARDAHKRASGPAPAVRVRQPA